MSKMNKELIGKIYDIAINDPERFYMASWFSFKDIDEDEGEFMDDVNYSPTGNKYFFAQVQEHVHNCGTACCLAGWAIALSSEDEVNAAIKQVGKIRQRAVNGYPGGYPRAVAIDEVSDVLLGIRESMFSRGDDSGVYFVGGGQAMNWLKENS